MKRKILGILSLCCLLALLPRPVMAADETLEQQMIESCTYGKRLDVTEYQLTESELEKLFYGMQYEGKLPWYVDSTFNFRYSEATKQVLEFEPVLLNESYDRMAYEQAVAAILADCISEGMEPWQKALVIHDYLILNCVYDESLTLRSGYDLLINGSTVCSGYAALYHDLLLRLGIPCLQVESEPMEHVWNLVQLDGNWYHVDVTWDDPSPDTYGMVDHHFFLKTDAQMQAGEDPHYDWETDIQCTDRTYGMAFWDDVYSGIFFTDNNTCYYLKETDCRSLLYSRKVAENKESLVYSEKETYLDIGYGRYAYFHTGLSLRDGRLWLCTMTEVLSMKPDGSDRKVEYTYDAKASNRYLAGCYAAEDTMYMTLCDHEGAAEVLLQPLAATEKHRHSFAQTVTEATCAEAGYTMAVCGCGLTAVGDQKATLEHDWERISYQKMGLFSDGYEEKTCRQCGVTETEEISRLIPEGSLPIKKIVTVFAVIVVVVAVPQVVAGVLLLRRDRRSGE